jgi:hypothetical protein
MMTMTTSYDYETEKKLASMELKDKHDLSANFLTFTDDSYKLQNTHSIHQRK